MSRFRKWLFGLYRYAIGRPVHCWAGHSDQYEFGSNEWANVMVDGDGTCFRFHGHFGPHKFTPDSDLMISFPVMEAKP